MDQFYYESGYIDDKYFVYTADAQGLFSAYVEDGFIEVGYYQDNSAFATLTAELTQKTGVLVEATGSWSSAFNQSIDALRYRFGESSLSSSFSQSSLINVTKQTSSTQSSEFSIFAFGSRGRDIDLLAFTDAAVTTVAERTRSTDVSLSSEFTFTATFGNVQSAECNITAAFSPEITANAILVVSMLTEMIAAFNSNADRYRATNVTLENILNLSSQSDRIRDNNSTISAQADLNGTATRIQEASSTQSVASSLTTQIDKIVGFTLDVSSTFSFTAFGSRGRDIDLIAFTDAAVTTVSERIRDNQISANAEFTQTAQVGANQQAEAAIFAIFSESAIITRLGRTYRVPTVYSGGRYDTIRINNSSSKWGAGSLAYDNATDIYPNSRNIVWTGSEYVHVEPGYTWKSSNGTSWTRYSNNLTGSTSYALTYANGTFARITGTSYNPGTLTLTITIQYSSNANTWTTITQDIVGGGIDTFSLPSNASIRYLNSQWRFVVRDVRNSTWRLAAYSSATLTSNSFTRTELVNTGLTDIVTGETSLMDGGIYFYYRNNSTFLGSYYFYNGSTTTNVAFNITNLSSFYTNGGTERVIYSNDSWRYSTNSGSNYTAFTTPTYITNVYHRGGRWFVVAGNGTYSGTSITNLSLVSDTKFTSNVAYGSNRWVATAIDGNSYVSTDGLSYTKYEITPVSGLPAKIVYTPADNSSISNIGTIDFWTQYQITGPSGRIDIGDGNTLYIGISGSVVIYINNQYTAASSTLSQGTWHHVRLTKSGNTVSFYVNGTRIWTGTVTGLTQTSIGVRGVIDELLVSDAILTDPSQTTYTVPTSSWTNNSDTKLLTHFDVNFEDDNTELPRTRLYSANLQSAFITSQTGTKTSNVVSNQSSQSTLFALGSRTTDIDIVAFTNATVTTVFDKLRAFNADVNVMAGVTASLDGLILADSTIDASIDLTSTVSRIRDQSISTESVASTMIVVAKVGNILVTVESQATQVTDAVKTTDSIGNLNSEFNKVIDFERIRDVTESCSSEFTQTATYDIYRQALADFAVYTELSSVAVKIVDETVAIVSQFTQSTDASGSKIGIEADYFAEFTANIVADKLKNADSAISSTANIEITVDKIVGYQSQQSSNTAVAVDYVRVRDNQITTEAVSTQMSVVAKVATFFINCDVIATATSQATKTTDINASANTTATLSSVAIKTTEVVSNQQVIANNSVTPNIIKSTAVSMANEFALYADGDVSAVVVVVVENFATMAIDVMRIRSNSSVVSSQTAVQATIARTRTGSMLADSVATLQSRITADVKASANIVSQFNIIADPAILHITQYVYVIPREVRDYTIAPESRYRKIASETRNYIIRS